MEWTPTQDRRLFKDLSLTIVIQEWVCCHPFTMYTFVQSYQWKYKEIHSTDSQSFLVYNMLSSMPQPLSFQRRKRKNAGDIELGKRDAGVYLGRRRLLPLHHHRPRCLGCHPPRCGQRLARPGHAPPRSGSPP